MMSENAIKTTAKVDELPQDMEDFKDQNFRYNLSKFDYDLYHEEDDVSAPIIRVKRFTMPNDGERWKIFENGTEKFLIEGYKLNKKQRNFLRSADGMNFMIGLFKNGIRSFNYFKIQLRNKLK